MPLEQAMTESKGVCNVVAPSENGGLEQHNRLQHKLEEIVVDARRRKSSSEHASQDLVGGPWNHNHHSRSEATMLEFSRFWASID